MSMGEKSKETLTLETVTIVVVFWLVGSCLFFVCLFVCFVCCC